MTDIKTRLNEYAFIWHAFFLALTSSFTEINTVVASLILIAGGSEIHLGILTAIMVGVPPLTKLFFAGFLHIQARKKPWLLLGINLRVASLAFIALLLGWKGSSDNGALLIFILFLLLLIFAVSGSFSGISYTDILGKSLLPDARKRFFIVRQYFQNTGLLISALLVGQLLEKWVYPDNYKMLFLLASVLLLLGSGGFWRLKEKHQGEILKKLTFIQIIQEIPATLKKDRNLFYYIIFQNLTGFGLMLFPFYIGYARQVFGLNSQQVGHYLILQITGGLLATLIWGRLVQRGGYKAILKGCISVSVLLPFFALWAAGEALAWYRLVFFFSGFAISARHIAF
jgi:Na+/melibiose symporter-like transporter